ncbi:hypothetical protein [Plastoroseomonas arctica]|uniref:Cbb3-type cytochrome c oxidase subunit I n=1 Tax=Plastoroseomonas arctica TaxID=1509237 RepID=A0AAF1KI03_9PROT|nr:hypothetical protein [Plastoroseomonas arctica]MBR0654539.1 hypothetical protein [Plastoroseomonas arctica]
MRELPRRFLLAAIGAGLSGVTMGMYMGIAQDFRFAHVHAQVNLLGWVSLALYGLVYQAAPALAVGWLPRLQFWLSTIGPLLMCTGLATHRADIDALHPLVPLGAFMTASGMLVFGVVVIGAPSARGVEDRARAAQAARDAR